jgi:hypothetical protein
MSSMQWRDGTVYLEGPDGRTKLKTSAQQILDIWPGPQPGLFGVLTTNGVGVLIGSDVVGHGWIGAPRAMIRTSRTNTLWSAYRDGSATVFLEWVSSAANRIILKIASPIVDFDVDRSGRLLYLATAGALEFAWGPNDHLSIAIPVRCRRAPIEHVFLSANSEEAVVYSAGTLCRYVLDERRWSDHPVNVATQALVRHAASRRIAIEPRFR